MQKQEILNKYGQPQKVGYDGHVRLVDYMGDDAAVVQAARVSYGAGTKTVRDDEKLIRYLMRHRHCYTPEMEVLTSEGWKRWDHCKYDEIFMVPDPETRTYRRERLPVEVFDCDEEVQVFENNRMSYRVTSDHRMWFKGKYRDNFEIVRASEMSKWGHFDPALGYTAIQTETASPLGRLIGFALGDGSWSGNGLSFHLRKPRKKAYLKQCLADLNVYATESKSSTYEDATVFYIKADDVLRLGLKAWINPGSRAADKHIVGVSRLITNEKWHDLARGIWDGLVNSDGYLNKDRRNRVEFSSASPRLARDFETLSAFFGLDAHAVSLHRDGIHCVIAYPPGATTLEARKEHFKTEHYRGKVYCATTSTGLLMVRGGPDKYGFVCGNTTPFEMVVFKFHVRVPMDTWRQWIRHRTASVNEYSTRYSEAIDSRELTRVEEWRLQSKNNKQGSAGTVLEADYSDHDTLTNGAEVADYLSQREMELHELSTLVYKERLEAGVAREQARKDLPLSTYTEAYWEMNLHNLLHFLRLRMHPHAQQEIREFAQAIYEIVKEVVPITAKAFEDYQLNGCFFSSEELDCLAEIINMAVYVNPKTGAQKNILELDGEERREFLEQFISTKRERIEFWNKLKC